MTPRVNLITLGVTDMARSRTFYAALGFSVSSASNENVTFFDANGIVLGLFGHDDLAEDAHVKPDKIPEFRGVSLAWNMASEAEVDAALAHAAAIGARIMKTAEKVFWGGYSGYFADPDGYLWEVAHNPFFPLDAEGRIRLP